MLHDDHCSYLETFDIKFTAILADDDSYGKMLDVRVKFEHGKAIVLRTRKNEVKTLMLNVICLHR